MAQSFSNKAAIVGIGYTEYSKESGKSVLELALEASHAAIADAGLKPSDIDGLLSYHLGDSVPVATVAQQLGLQSFNWHNDIYGGGSQCASILGDVAMIIDAKAANTILVYRAMNGRSGKRMGQVSMGAGDNNEQQFFAPYGLLGPLHQFALNSQRYLHESGYTKASLADVVISQRHYASKNPRALLQKPLTMAEYLASPMMASPLRRVDCCLETDGGCALVITSRDHATHLPQPPVYIQGAVRGGFTRHATDAQFQSISGIFSQYIAPLFYRECGVSPADIDIAYLYDAYSFLVLQQLEDFGFCDRGAAEYFVGNGETTLSGSLPTNTNGGLLAEAYVHGLNNIIESVLQLRGQCGNRQVQNAHLALCTGFGGSYGAAALLSNGK